MEWINAAATVRCDHYGRVANHASRSWIFAEDMPMLVKDDPEGREITGCPNFGPAVKPCWRSLRASKGYSELVYVDGAAAVGSQLSGLTDGTPPGMVRYSVIDPGQVFVYMDR
jgi:hypothetical protein